MKFTVNRALTDLLSSLEKRPAVAVAIAILWLLVIGWVAFLWNLGNTGLVDETEPLFAEAARQMSVTGNWITPYFNEATRFDKPPLIYWLMAIGFKIVGVNEWAVRLPSALGAIALCAFGFWTLRHYGFPLERRREKGKGEGEQRSGGAEEQRSGGAEEQRSRGAGEQRSGGAEEQRSGGAEEQRSGGAEEHFLIPNPQSPIPNPQSPIPNPQSPLTLWLSAFLGSALIALNPETIAWGRVGVSDMLLCACMGSALLAFFMGYAEEGRREKGEGRREKGEERREKGEGRRDNFLPSFFDFLGFTSPWYLAFYILLALAILTKGPVGIVLPALIIGCFLLYVGKFREVLGEMGVFRGSLIVLAIALPWYVLVTLANGETYLDTFFGYHNLERFTSVVNRHWAPWYFYFVVVPIGFAPWSVYLPVAIARLRFWERSRWQALPRSRHLGLFALCWFAAIFGFFTIAVTKLPSYVLPLMPAAAILVALLFSGELQPLINHSSLDIRPSKSLARSGWVNVVLFVALSVGLFSSSRWLGKIKDPAMPNLSEVIQQSGLLIVGAVILAVMAGGCIWLLLRRQQSWLWGVNLVGFLAFLIFAVQPASFMFDEMRQMPLRELAETAIEVKQPGEQLVMIGFEKPSLVFYTRKPVTYFRQSKLAIAHIKKISQSQPNPPSILMLGYPSKFDDAGLQPNEYKVLNRVGAYQLVRASKQVVARLHRPDPG